MSEKLTPKIESGHEQEPTLCWECGKPMVEGNAYLFPDNIMRLEVPYFFCPTDRTAEINIQELTKRLEGSKFSVEDIKTKFQQEFRFRLKRKQ